MALRRGGDRDHAHAPTGELGAGVERVAAVVARPDEQHGRRSTDQTASGPQRPADVDRERERRALHERIDRTSVEHRLFGGPDLGGGISEEHGAHHAARAGPRWVRARRAPTDDSRGARPTSRGPGAGRFEPCDSDSSSRKAGDSTSPASTPPTSGARCTPSPRTRTRTTRGNRSGCTTTSTPSPSRRRRRRTRRGRSWRRSPRAPRACAWDRCARAWRTATPRTSRRSPRPSTASPGAASRWASARAGTSTSGAHTATASPVPAPGSPRSPRACRSCARCGRRAPPRSTGTTTRSTAPGPTRCRSRRAGSRCGSRAAARRRRCGSRRSTRATRTSTVRSRASRTSPKCSPRTAATWAATSGRSPGRQTTTS